MASPVASSFPRLLGRALLRRCPWCGGKGAWFRSWFKRNDRCNTCGLKWNREQDGFELGAMTVAVLITGGSVMVFLGIFIAATYPTFHVLPMVSIAAAIALVMPVITYPYTQTIWSAFDIRVHPPRPEEFTSSTPERFLPEPPAPAAVDRQVDPASMWASPLRGDPDRK